MYKTIRFTAQLFAQGILIGTLEDGRVQISISGKTYTGYPV